MAFTIDDPDSQDAQRFVTLGTDALGRMLVVIHTQRGERTHVISARKASRGEADKYHGDEYDFSNAKREPVISSPGKTRITIMLDDDVIEHFRSQAESQGIGYQTLINAILRNSLVSSKKSEPDEKPLTVATLRRVLREELHAS